MTAEIQLSGGRVALVDATDFPLVAAYSWHCRNGARPYVQASIKCGNVWKTRMLHRFILTAPMGVLVDHRDGDVLNNRRANLRLATPRQNAANRQGAARHGFVGITPSGDGWGASIAPFDDSIFLGVYETPEIAAEVYNQAARAVFGEFATHNNVPPIPGALEAVVARKLAAVARLTFELKTLTGGSANGSL